MFHVKHSTLIYISTGLAICLLLDRKCLIYFIKNFIFLLKCQFFVLYYHYVINCKNGVARPYPGGALWARSLPL